MKLRFSLIVLFTQLVLIASACAAPEAELALAPESALPDFVRDAPPQVKEAYRFAAANPEVLSAFPCYCGCGAVGHKNNLQCYIKEVRPDGSIEFENHAFG
ncbi:MAG: hypothetical protein Kow0063_14260 [Anaerolineae bacterium]